MNVYKYECQITSNLTRIIEYCVFCWKENFAVLPSGFGKKFDLLSGSTGSGNKYYWPVLKVTELSNYSPGFFLKAVAHMDVWNVSHA